MNHERPADNPEHSLPTSEVADLFNRRVDEVNAQEADLAARLRDNPDLMNQDDVLKEWGHIQGQKKALQDIKEDLSSYTIQRVLDLDLDAFLGDEE